MNEAVRCGPCHRALIVMYFYPSGSAPTRWTVVKSLRDA
jgi:hypothetical protein